MGTGVYFKKVKVNPLTKDRERTTLHSCVYLYLKLYAVHYGGLQQFSGNVMSDSDPNAGILRYNQYRPKLATKHLTQLTTRDFCVK